MFGSFLYYNNFLSPAAAPPVVPSVNDRRPRQLILRMKLGM